MLRPLPTIILWIIFWALIAYATIAKGAQATLKWQDNSGNETGFRVYRKLPGENVFSIVATTASNVATYIDGTTAEGACYQVKAFNDDGESLPSNTACLIFSPTNLVIIVIMP